MSKYIDIISRTDWGHRYGLGWSFRNLPAEHVIIHHSVTVAPAPGASFGQDAAAVRLLDQIGYERFRYADYDKNGKLIWPRPSGAGISYTWAIPKSGRVFEGHDVRRFSSHTAGYNDTGVGIVFIGNYDNDTLTDAQIDAAARTVLQAKEDGVVKHARVDFRHSDVYDTACPGKNAMSARDRINARIQEILEKEDDDMRKEEIARKVNEARLSGSSRWETARAVFEAKLPAGRGVLIAADGSPDERYVTARAEGDVKYLPVRPNNDNPPGATAAAIRAYKPQWIRVAGGSNVVTDTCVYNLLTAAGLI